MTSHSDRFGFRIETRSPDSLARAGVIHTPHGDIETPAFIVVGTKATVKALTPLHVREAGAQAVLANTYHLYLEPGSELVREAGGLHSFMSWDGPMFTDSGGFQVFSLGAAFGKGISKVASSDGAKEGDGRSAKNSHARPARIDEDGVAFTSHLDGSTHRFTPESSMEIQHDLGADIIFAFDECTSPHDPHDAQERSLARTHRWGERSLARHRALGGPQALYGVVQGGKYQDLREHSARTLGAMDFDGYGIGGSFNKEDIGTAVAWVDRILPEGKPRHLLGIGEPIDLFLGVENGIDTFDCVSPTRIGRNGALYTRQGRININNARFVRDFGPIDEGCSCYTCAHFTRAYVAHLFRAEEMLGATLASIHNIHFIVELVKKIRRSILDGRFVEFKQEFLGRYYTESQN